jgi:hypothetical protein
MGIRTFRDGDGRSWRVWHVTPQSDVLRAASPGLARGWLCFENDGDKRRLVDPPAEWATHTDDQLIALLGGATPVRKLAT